jgi:plasmid stabilization system protein ParE
MTLDFPVSLRADAESDLTEAALWYEDRSPGLGAELIRCVEEAIDRVRRHPRSFAADEEGVRCVPVRRFPYCLLYLLDEEKAVVFAV